VRPRKRRPKKAVRDPSKPLRRSVWLLPTLVRDIETLAKSEERKFSDMIRILIQRGVRATRGTPDTV